MKYSDVEKYYKAKRRLSDVEREEKYCKPMFKKLLENSKEKLLLEIEVIKNKIPEVNEVNNKVIEIKRILRDKLNIEYSRNFYLEDTFMSKFVDTRMRKILDKLTEGINNKKEYVIHFSTRDS